MHISGPNLSTGFYASAVDIGRLQAALEHGLARLDETQLEARWDEIVTPPFYALDSPVASGREGECVTAGDTICR
jgi:hypothetical protein